MILQNHPEITLSEKTIYNYIASGILSVRNIDLPKKVKYKVRTSIYYCDPMCSWQKPHCEKNHEYIRKICPKGTSFDEYSQEDIHRMMRHINSSLWQSLGNLSPMALAKLMLPKELLDFFGLMDIPADEIVLTPALLKK